MRTAAFQMSEVVPVPEPERRFCTGQGQSDTHAEILSDGRRNPHASAGHPYGTIAGAEIEAMVADPDSVPKDQARWFLPSAYAGSDARSHDAQRNLGTFWWLVLDLDDNNPGLQDVLANLDAIVGVCSKLIYSSRSATPDRQKWRALIPLKRPIAGVDYSDTAAAFYDLLENASGGVLIPDRKLQGPGQLVYLPNRGAHFDHHIHRTAPLDLPPDHPIIRWREQRRAARARAEREAKAARERRMAERQSHAGHDDVSPVDHFNASHAVDDLLDRYGYRRAGHSNDWRSPMQTSASYATRSREGWWVSLSGSDAAAEIGAATKTGNRHGDAFDLFCYFVHGGDFKAAVAAYGVEIRPERTTSGLTANSDEHPSQDKPDGMDQSQDALANDMGNRGWNQNAKYVSKTGKWFFWTGTHWQTDDRLDHVTRTRAYLRTRADELTKWAEAKAEDVDAEKNGAGDRLRKRIREQAHILRSKNTVAAVVDLARSNPASVSLAKSFDADLMMLGTPGGTVNLNTGLLRPAQRTDMVTKQTAVAPAPAGTNPARWLAFLFEIFNGDQDVIDFMQRAAGYALTGRTTEHKLLFLYGTGRNGKSVFLNTLFELWGDYARKAPAAAFLNSQTERHPTDLAGLHGARLVAGSELPRGKSWDESVIKDLTGGDKMTARFMRGDFFDFDPQLTLMIAGNNQPSFKGVDEAIRARVVLVPFTVTFPPERRDKHLPDKLRAEGPAILRWAIDGALQWQKIGLSVPASVLAASDGYFDDEDTLGQFLADESVKDPTGFVTTSDLHMRFVQWSDRQGLNSWTLRTLQKEMVSRGFAVHRQNHGRGFSGIRLR